MKKVLVIEDESAHFDKIKMALEGIYDAFEVFPKKNNDTDLDFDNRGFLMDSIIKNNASTFDLILAHYNKIDLFIVDVSLVSRVSTDKIGMDFLNYLKNINYRMGSYKILITSRHNFDSLGNLNFDFNPVTDYVSKSKWDDLFPQEIVKSAIKLLNLDEFRTNIGLNIENNLTKANKREWWVTLPDKIEKHIINRFILLVTYLIVIATGLYAVWGTISQTFHILHDLASATVYLEYVEHIYLFFLPLFIVFSFLSYYKSTIEIKLTGGNLNDIDHKGAMNSLENSKLILLSSILTFTIIKIIEKIFVDNLTEKVSLISYGILLLILIVYSIFQHKINLNHTKNP